MPIKKNLLFTLQLCILINMEAYDFPNITVTKHPFSLVDSLKIKLKDGFVYCYFILVSNSYRNTDLGFIYFN